MSMFGGNRGNGRKKKIMPMYIHQDPDTIDPGRWHKGRLGGFTFRNGRPHYGGPRPFTTSELPPAASITLKHRYGPGSRW